MKNLFLFLLMAAATTIISCKGEQGIPGPAGVAGQDGKDGENGNGNIVSTTFELNYTDWVAVSNYEYKATLMVPILTQDIVDKGLVMVYLKSPYLLGLDNSNWYVLPFTLAREYYTESFAFSTKLNQLTLVDTSNDGVPFKPSGKVRVVATPADGIARNPDLDWTNYEAVKSALGLED